MGGGDDHGTSTQLDSHANMVVVGQHATVFGHSGKSADVRPFSNDCSKLESVPIVDAAMAYDCPFTMKTYILAVKNALHVPTMEHNLIPPFIMREAGLQVNDVLKIHTNSGDLSANTHCVVATEDANGIDLKIPMKLDGIFSYFPTRKLTEDEINNCEYIETLQLCPEGDDWDPYDESFADREEQFTNYRGELIERPHKRRRLIDEADIDSIDVSAERYEYAISSVVSRNHDIVDESMLRGGNPQDADSAFKMDDDYMQAGVADLSACFNDELLSEMVTSRASKGKLAMEAGSVRLNDMFSEDDDLIFESSAAHVDTPKGVTAAQLSKVWCISEEDAKRTLDVTTQLNKQDADASLARRFGTNDRMLRYRRINSLFYTDTFYSKKVISKRGYSMMQLFVSDKGFVKVYGMKSEREFPDALKLFCKEVGAPTAIVVDPHQSQKSDKVRQFLNKVGTTLRVLEESTQHADRAELYIGLLKKAVGRDLRESNSPMRLWCYCAERRASIMTLTANNLFQLQGQNPYMATLNDMGDISNLCQFGWYEWVYFREHKEQFPGQKNELGRCLGPTKNEGNEMCQWILRQNGQVVPRRTLRRLKPEEISPTNVAEANKRAAFDAAIMETLGDSIAKPPPLAPPRMDPTNNFDYDEDDELATTNVVPEADAVDSTGRPINQQSVTDLLINAEVLLPQEDSQQMAKVVRRAIDSEGLVIGEFNENPILNSLVYDVEFPDGVVKQYAANVIAENVLGQVDESGFHSQSLKSIFMHEKLGNAVSKSDAYITTKRGVRKPRQTTIGWRFLCEWKDGASSWVALKSLKESNPVDIAEYVTAIGLDDEPAFKWWVPYTLKKRDTIVAAINTRVRKKTHKFGIRVPTSVAEAKAIDDENGNTLWQDALAKEMFEVGVAFKILDDHELTPVGYTKSSGHIIWDIKMDFTRKARWVKDGHRTPDLEDSKYAGVVSRESIRIMLTYAALHGIPVLAADIRNAYLQAPTSEKHFIICGKEFGLENEGKRAVIVRALYGGKAAGRDFWHHLRSCMGHLGFKSKTGDPDVWMRPATRKDGSQTYEYVLLYTDDCLVVADNAESILKEEIGRYFQLKPESIGPPTIYLGGHLRLVEIDDGTLAWAFSSTHYVQAAVNNVEEYLKKRGKSLTPKARDVIPKGYRPEIDVTPELEPGEASYYASLIGILRWMVELGRVDICTEVSMMSSHLALPRKGHLETVFHMFAHLKKKHNSEMVFDPSDPTIEEGDFPREDWSLSIYGDVNEELPKSKPFEESGPGDMPEPRGRGFRMRVYVDCDLGGELVTRRSRTGFVVFLNNAPIYWLSKKQGSCEVSTFGSEFTAMKQAVEYVRGLRYKLRMFGIPCDEPTFVYGDNKSVLSNTSVPASTLKKKMNSLSYHFVREGCARDEWRTAYVNTHDNLADLLTKPLPSGEKRDRFVRQLLYWISSVR